MLGTGIYKQFFVHLTAQTVLGKHSFNRSFDQHLGPALDQALGGFFFTASGITTEGIVDLFVHFVTGELYFFAVGNNDVVAAVDMWRVGRLVFATQYGGNPGTHTTYGLISTVDNVPVALYGSLVRMLGGEM